MGEKTGDLGAPMARIWEEGGDMGVTVESLLEVEAAAVDFSGTVDRVELLLLLLLLVLPVSDSVNAVPKDPASLPSTEGVAAGVPSSEVAAALPRLGRALSFGANLVVPLSIVFPKYGRRDDLKRVSDEVL